MLFTYASHHYIQFKDITLDNVNQTELIKQAPQPSDATEMIVLGFQQEKGPRPSSRPLQGKSLSGGAGSGHVRRGGALLGLGRPAEAAAEYAAALRFNPENAAYRQYLPRPLRLASE